MSKPHQDPDFSRDDFSDSSSDDWSGDASETGWSDDSSSGSDSSSGLSHSHRHRPKHRIHHRKAHRCPRCDRHGCTSCDVGDFCPPHFGFHHPKFCPPFDGFHQPCFPQFPSCFPACDFRVGLRLGGLTQNLNFQLLRARGCLVKVVFECAGERETVIGRVCNAGTDFVDIRLKDKTIVKVLTQRICFVKFRHRPRHRHC